MRGKRLFGAVVLMSTLEVQAQNITTPDPEGCVDPTEFASCLANANTTAIQCASQPNAGITACEVQALVDEMLCYYGSCWNKVSPSQNFNEKQFNARLTGMIRYIPAPINISHLSTCLQSIETISKAHLSILHLPMLLTAALAIWASR